MTYVIEHDVPVPVGKISIAGTMTKLKIGDSFVVPFNGRDHKRLRITILATGRNLRQKGYPDHRYTTREVENGIRVWRIK